MIKVSNVSFSYGEKPLYENISFVIGKGQKVGLVGPNGAGKSTLFNILTGEIDPTNGNVGRIGTIALVPQEVKRDPELEKAQSVRDYLDPNAQYQNYEMVKMLNGMGLTDIHLDDKPTDFSGGQKTKLALARALFAEPDILLLDEPTNFMDFEGKRFVMNFLSNYPKTLILVSHDLELMDHAVDKVLYVNPGLKTIEEYKGNYTEFKRLKEKKDELFKRKRIVEQKKIKRMEEAVVKAMRFKSEKGVRARVQLQRRLEKMKENLPELPSEIRKIRVVLPQVLPIGELPIRGIGISKSYQGEAVLDNANITLYRGEKLVLIGPNGAGKSTLIKILTRILEPESGEVIHAPNLSLGYYSQEFENFDMSKKLITIMEEVSKKEEKFNRSMLGRFNFIGDKIFQRVESLSGGEKTRLSIALLCARPSNVLILDEPTTYLDVMSQRIILETLKEYKGTMLLVSHNPEFVKELKPDRAYLLPEAKLTYWDDEFLNRVDET